MNSKVCPPVPGRARRLILAALVIAAGAVAGPGVASAQTPPQAAMIVDARTGQTLHASNADAERHPASLTKIMTLYMLFDLLKQRKLDLHTPLPVSQNAAAQAPSKIGVPAGQTITVADAVRSLVTKSANDVAVVVAEAIGGTEESFARMMTTQARRMGMTRTTFRNASGLPDMQQVTTARDMVTLGRRIMSDHPDYYAFFSTRHFTYAGTRYRNHNKLLFDYGGTDGIKTGYTRASGFNLLASVRRDDKHVIGVVIGGKTAAQRDAQMRRLLDQAFPRAVAARAVPRMAMPVRNPAAEDGQAQVPAGPVLASVAPSAGAVRAAAQAPRPAVAIPMQKPQVEEGDADSQAFHVQVGAFTSRIDADRRLTDVQARMGGLLQGRQPLTISYGESARPLFRARFAGFSEDDARGTCDELRRHAVDCVVMRAE